MYNEIQPKVLRVFLLAIHSHLLSFALRFIFLLTHATSYSFFMVYAIHTETSSLKKSQDYAQKPQRNCAFMNSASG
jgi:hypothetical protein